MRMRWIAIVAFAACGLFAQSAMAAMYKWVDSRGVVHYSDRLPESTKTTPTRITKSGLSTPAAESKQTETRLTVQEMEQQKAEAKRQLERQRQDAALLATYSTEGEIDAAREREQKRHQETMKLTTAGLAGSTNPEDKRRLDALLLKGQQEADAINARFDAQKARFREMTAGRPMAQAGKPEGAAPTP